MSFDGIFSVCVCVLYLMNEHFLYYFTLQISQAPFTDVPGVQSHVFRGEVHIGYELLSGNQSSISTSTGEPLFPPVLFSSDFPSEVLFFHLAKIL